MFLRRNISFLLLLLLLFFFFCPKIAVFPQSQVYLSTTQAKQRINFSKGEEIDEIIVYGSVTRYGPQSSWQVV